MKTKLLSKLSIIFSLIISLCCFAVPVSAASFSLTASANQVAPGASFTISIGGDCVGRINLKASGGTIAQSAVWVEENRQSVAVTAGNSGTVTITATPEAGLSDSDGNEYKPGARSVSVKIVAPSQPAQTKPNPSTNNNTTSTSKPQSTTNKPQNTNKPQTSTTKPSEENSTESVEPEQNQTPETSNDSQDSNQSKDDDQESTTVLEEILVDPCQTIKDKNKLAWILVAILAAFLSIVIIVLTCLIVKYQKLVKTKNTKKTSKHEKTS